MDFRGIGGTPQQVSRSIEKSTSSQQSPPSSEPKLGEEISRPLRRPSLKEYNQSSQQTPPKMPSLPALPPLPNRPILLGDMVFTEREIPEIKTEREIPGELKLSQSSKSNFSRAKQTLSDAAKLKAFEALYAATGKQETSKTQASPEMTRQMAMGLIEIHAAGNKPLTPEQCAQLANQLKPAQDKDGAMTTTMLRLYDIAAEIHESSNEPIKAFQVYREAYDACKFNKDHSLYKMTEAIDKNSRTLYGKGGLHLSSGSQHVVGELVFQTRPHPDNKPRDELSYEISSVGRAAFESRLEMIQNNLEAFNKFLPKELGNVSFKILPNKAEPHSKFFQGRDENGNFSCDSKKGFSLSIGATFHEIEFTKDGKPIGKVSVGSSNEYGSLYKLVRAEVLSNQDKGQSLKTMQGMLTFLGLGAVLGTPLAKEDQVRLKMGLIAETYFPQCWIELQKDKSFYHLSEKDLENKIISMLPLDQKNQAAELFIRYKKPGLIGEIEIFPGKKRLTLNDVSTQMQEKGFIGCMAGVSNSTSAASICDLGFFSTAYRHQSGIVGAGESSLTDISTEGSLGEFGRGVTEANIGIPFPEKKWKPQDPKNPNSEKVLDEYNVPDNTWKFSGKYQFIIAPEVVNSGAYAFYGDFFGVKAEGHEDYQVYKNRDNLIDFAGKLGEAMDRYSTKPDIVLNDQGLPINPDGSIKKDPLKGTLNEIVIPGGVLPPKHFLGINCINHESKLELIRAFEKKGMLVDPKIENGKVVDHTLLMAGGNIRVSLNEFLYVGNQLKKEMWKKKG